MAASTLTQIITEGCLQAGVTGIDARITNQFNKWLRSMAEGFLWPVLKREALVTLGVGVQILTLGNGSGGIAQEIQRINDPLKLGDATFGTQQDVRIQTDWPTFGAQAGSTAINQASNTGSSYNARVKPNVTATLKNRWDVIFERVADKAYNVEVSYYIIPPDPATTDVVWYPNDRTSEQCALYLALKYNKDMAWKEELQLLAAHVATDRMSEGQKPGINDDGIKLNPRYFR